MLPQQAYTTSKSTLRSGNEGVKPLDAAPTAASSVRCSARPRTARYAAATHSSKTAHRVACLWSCKRSDFCIKRSLQACRASNNDYSIENFELVIGDCVALLLFCLYKQITAIILSPTFPGWFAPLAFNPIRFVEFGSFALTVIGTWAASAALVGGYRRDATAGIPTTLTRVSRIFLASMPVAAAQLVLVAAAESDSLVGDEGFASKLPLAASGPGEPFVTAAGVLGMMSMWRSFYCVYLDPINGAGWLGRDQAMRDAAGLRDALAAVAGMVAVCGIVLQLLQLLLGDM